MGETKRVALVFLAALLPCAALQAQPSFPDPDSFYHVKLALLTGQHGPVRQFPWLPFTGLSRHFADHHFLYHLLLVPFTWVWGPEWGTKVATALLGAGALAAFYAAARALGGRFAWAFAAVLAGSSGFLFRLNLAKASAAVLILMMALVVAVQRRQGRAALALCWAYVWTHAGWPLAFGLLGAPLAAEGLGALWRREPLGQALRPGARVLALGSAGVLGGLLTSPFMPHHLAFYWAQFVQIGVVGSAGQVELANEFQPVSPAQFFSDNGVTLLLALLGLALWGALALAARLQDAAPARPPPVSLGGPALVAGTFLLLATRSHRHVEYLAPFGLLFDCLLWTRALGALDLARAGRAWRPLLALGALGLAGALVPWGARGYASVRGLYAAGIPLGRYAGAAGWLAEHAPEGATVFHANWDDFPLLFLHDDRQRFISGLDPTFLFLADPARFRLYEDLGDGRLPPEVARVIVERFGAHLAFVGLRDQALGAALAQTPGARQVYADAEAQVFELP